MSINMPKICGRKCASMLLVVVQCTLHLLVLTRCSIVFDVRNQEAEKNIYCSTGAQNCPPGTNVLCMYNATEMGPRCDQGELINLEKPEREFIRHIFNGFKRAISKGEEVLGKDDKVLPRGKHLLYLHWDQTMARGAQAWANQCNPLKNDLCHNFGGVDENGARTGDVLTTTAGQLIDTIRFGYPNWSYPQTHFDDDSPKLTLERIRFAITEFAKGIYAKRKEVTEDMIKNYTGKPKYNSYMQAVAGNTKRIGCGMAKFVDYMVGNKKEPYIYNAVIIVCNFSTKPLIGHTLYDVVDGYKDGVTVGPDFDWCQECISPTTMKDDCLCSDPKADRDDYTMDMPVEECDAIVEKERRERRPAVVLLPIFAVEDGDPNKQLSKETTSPANERKKQALREKIKGQVEKVRDRYFKNYFVIEPGARLPDGGPVDADTFALSRFKPGPTITSKVNVGQRGEDLEDLQITTKRQRHTVKHRKDFSNMEHLVSEYLSRKHKFKSLSTANVQSLKDLTQFTTATVTPNLEHFIGLSTRESRYGVRGTPERDLIDFENRMTDIKKMVQYKIRNTGRDIPGIYNNLLRPVKSMQRGDLMYYIRPSFEYEQRSIAQRNNVLSRNINPLHSHDYSRTNPKNRRFKNDRYVNVHDKPPVMNYDYDDRQIRNGDAYLSVNSDGHNRRPNQPYVYGTNKIRHLKVRSNYRRPLKHHDDNSRHFDLQRGESMDARHERRYLVPDRLNHMREL